MKREVVGHTDKTRNISASEDVMLPKSNSSMVISFGSRISAGQHLYTVLVVKKEEVQQLTRRFKLTPAHDSFFPVVEQPVSFSTDVPAADSTLQ